MIIQMDYEITSKRIFINMPIEQSNENDNSNGQLRQKFHNEITASDRVNLAAWATSSLCGVIFVYAKGHIVLTSGQSIYAIKLK